MLEPTYAMIRVYADIFGAEAVTAGYNASLQLYVDALREGRPGTALSLSRTPTSRPEQSSNTPCSSDYSSGPPKRKRSCSSTRRTPPSHQRPAPCRFSKRTRTCSSRAHSPRSGWPVSASASSPCTRGRPELLQGALGRRGERGRDRDRTYPAPSPGIGTDYAADVAAGREVLAARARALDLEPLPSHANFLQLRLPPRLDPEAVVSGLHERRWLVRGPFADRCRARCVRVTLGPPDLMATFADSLDMVVQDLT